VCVRYDCRVEPALFYLVFGESVLNDAVALTIFNIAEKFIGTDHGAKVYTGSVFKVSCKQALSTHIHVYIHSVYS
jgi:NhaP-type Na+/H+ or K+/H+ antiporter